MNSSKIRVGIRVKTKNKLDSTEGFLVADENLLARGCNREGEVIGWIPGHGGDLWSIRHNDGTVGAYSYTEFEEATQ